MTLLARQRLMLLLCIPVMHAADAEIAAHPAHVIVSPWKQHALPTKRQGVPGIECTANLSEGSRA